MFSSCTHCHRQQRVTVKQLRRYRGLLPCKHCGQRFDALALLTDKKSALSPEHAVEIGLVAGAEASPAGRWFWAAGNVMMLLLLTLQLAYFNSESVLRQPAIRSLWTRICGQEACAEPVADAADWSVSHGDLRRYLNGYYLFSAALTHQGDSPEVLPALHLTLSGLNGQPLAERIFQPEHYAREAFAAGEDTREIQLWLAAPVGKVGGFNVSLL